jgi:hypothetical protein
MKFTLLGNMGFPRFFYVYAVPSCQPAQSVCHCTEAKGKCTWPDSFPIFQELLRFPFIFLPHIPLQSPCHCVGTNIISTNCVKIFDIYASRSYGFAFRYSCNH